jgi:hypothetical protein
MLHTSATMRLAPDDDDRLILTVWVTNTGTAVTTLTTFALIVFDSWWERWRFKVGRNWVVIENVVGPRLPQELRPGQQWMGGIRQNEELAQLVASGNCMSPSITHSLLGIALGSRRSSRRLRREADRNPSCRRALRDAPRLRRGSHCAAGNIHPSGTAPRSAEPLPLPSRAL